LLGLAHIKNVEEPFIISSLHSSTKIGKKFKINLFNGSLYFFIFENLKEFDGIVGLDHLKKINARIDLSTGKIEHNSGSEDVQFAKYKDVNYTRYS